MAQRTDLRRRKADGVLAQSLFLLTVLLTACSDSGLPTGEDNGGADEVVAGVNLTTLFAPPTPSERSAVEADWAQRSPAAAEVVEEFEEEVSLGGEALRVRVVSHQVDGQRHFGAVLQAAEPPVGPIPVLVYAHGGDQGVGLEEVLLVAAALGLRSQDFVMVVPSLRSESLRVGSRSWRSEGIASPWDRDVDDALGLLDVALKTVPFADPERIGVLGFSRGGAVGLLMGIRDPRIDAVVSFFAPTDFFGPFVEGVVRETLRGSPPGLPGINFLADQVIAPLQDGRRSEAEARLELMRRSSARFADRLPAVQVHHGTEDRIVPVEEAQHLIQAMTELGRGEPEFEAHIYPGAGHSPLEMPQSVPRTRGFLSTFLGSPSPGLVAVR